MKKSIANVEQTVIAQCMTMEMISSTKLLLLF